MLAGNRFGSEHEFAELASNGCAKLDGLGWILSNVKARSRRRSLEKLTDPVQINKKAATRGVVGRVRRSGIPRDEERQNAFTIVGAKEECPSKDVAVWPRARTRSWADDLDALLS